ncbi:hypothetical protein EDM58_16980 [Brevibacillus panacihumi]|uniref:Uncharacterized protein n=1 Tax=Brevibacillus panacihumi TaxID=497735 RepID=A0A3M8CPA9_9BACL|nr:hypothetical protein EDM58_16980 [Brevibacillus panacihumi]
MVLDSIQPGIEAIYDKRIFPQFGVSGQKSTRYFSIGMVVVVALSRNLTVIAAYIHFSLGMKVMLVDDSRFGQIAHLRIFSVDVDKLFIHLLW